MGGGAVFVGLIVDSITTNHVTRPSSRRRSMIPVPRCRCRYLCDTRRSVRRSSRFPVWRARLPFRYSLPLRELSRIARLRVVLSAAHARAKPASPASGSLLTVVGFVRFVRWCGHVGGRVGQQFAEAGGSGRDAEYRVDADLMQLIDAGANMPGYCDDRLAVALGGFGHAGRRLAELGLEVDGALRR